MKTEKSLAARARSPQLNTVIADRTLKTLETFEYPERAAIIKLSMAVKCSETTLRRKLVEMEADGLVESYHQPSTGIIIWRIK